MKKIKNYWQEFLTISDKKEIIVYSESRLMLFKKCKIQANMGKFSTLGYSGKMHLMET